MSAIPIRLDPECSVPMPPSPPPEPREPFLLAVAGAKGLPPWFVTPALDRLTVRVRHDRMLTIVTRGGEGIADWCRGKEVEGVSCQVEPVVRDEYGRFAEARWAMRLCLAVDGIVVFGETGRWRRLLRYASDVGVPYRVVPVPDGIRAQFVWEIPRDPEPKEGDDALPATIDGKRVYAQLPD